MTNSSAWRGSIIRTAQTEQETGRGHNHVKKAAPSGLYSQYIPLESLRPCLDTNALVVETVWAVSLNQRDGRGSVHLTGGRVHRVVLANPP